MHNAQWLPEKPPQGLYFNDSPSHRFDPLASRCPPFTWTLFGDKDGSLLSSLTQIGVGTTKNGRLYKLWKGERIESMQVVAKDGINWLTTDFITCMTPIYYKVRIHFTS